MGEPPTPNTIPANAARIAATIGEIPGVSAVSLGGSASSGFADDQSDLDFHVFWSPTLATTAERETRLLAVADPDSLIVRPGTASWELEDWFAHQGQQIELIYVAWRDVEADIAAAYGDGLRDAEFTTARLHNYAHGLALYDPSGALTGVQTRLRSAYPEPTRRFLLRREPERLTLALKQLLTAQQRRDILFAQHRRYTLQTIFFNLLFALNRRYHPGEKRLLRHAATCPLQPADCAKRWEYVALLPIDAMDVEYFIGELVTDLLSLVREENTAR